MDVEGKSGHGTKEVIEIASAQTGSSDLEPLDNQNNGFLYLLRLDLVVEKLMRNVSVEEMKALSLVSKDALIVVRNSKVFEDRVQFRIVWESLRSRVLDNCFHSWKNVKFHVDFSDFGFVDYVIDSATISPSLDSVRSIFVKVRSWKWCSKSKGLWKVKGLALKIIENSRETLESLKMDFDNFDFGEIESIRCPNLKRLGLPPYYYFQDGRLTALLKNLPPLEELTGQTTSLAGLVEDLQGRMSKLRKLDIQIIGSRDPLGFDWNMAAGMTSLEDISVSLDYGYAQCVEQLFRNIHTETATKISLRRYFGRGDFFSRFTNVTDLKLQDCPEFDDDTLQDVIRSCKKLKNLTLERLAKVTDFGWSGVKNSPTGDPLHQPWNEQGVSLTELKDLVGLNIRHCGSVSLATLLRIIRFECLTSLDFTGRVHGPNLLTAREFLLQILQQNSSLNKIDLWIGNPNVPCEVRDCYPRRKESLENEAKLLYPRIQQIRFA